MQSPPIQSASRRRRNRRQLLPRLAAVFGVLSFVGLTLALAWLFWRPDRGGLVLLTCRPPTQSPTAAPSPALTAEPTELLAFPTLEPTSTEEPASNLPAETSSVLPQPPSSTYEGLIILSMSDGGYTHLFAYHPESLPFTRLTLGNWDDMHPSLDPSGTKVAFSSDRDGDWEIYILDLITGETLQFTDDDAFQSAPTWSPDGLWLAYEQYVDNNLEIFVKPLDGSFEFIRLTISPAFDHSPSWNPDGDRIAFVSGAAGQSDIWVASLSRLGETDFLTNLTRDSQHAQTSPSWSPDGTQLAWASEFEGTEGIFVSTTGGARLTPRYIGPGSTVRWDASGNYLLVGQRSPDQHYLAAYDVESRRYIFPPIAIFGRLKGFSWGQAGLPSPLPTPLQTAALAEVSAPWLADLQPGTGIPQRQLIIELENVTAPYPGLNQLATQPFYAFRQRLQEETGWDVLGDLENAYLPLTQPLPPFRNNDWLYTGRAIALHSVLIDLEWMVVIREDFASQTYWRVFVRTGLQDGSQGQPLTALPWDLRARFSGNTTDYEEGGALYPEVPSGYWVDVTDLGLEYGFDRLPALSNWRTFYPGIRFNILAVTADLDWETAMLQIYPPEIFLGP